MTCEHVKIGNSVAIICHGGRRMFCRCGQPAAFECDWKVPGKMSGTCDEPICAKCTTKPAPEKDLCKKHAETWQRHPARQQERTL